MMSDQQSNESVNKLSKSQSQKQGPYMSNKSRSQNSQSQGGKLSQSNQSSLSNSRSQFSQQSSKSCYRCARWHNPDTCPARNWDCFTCRTKGHTSRVCKKSKINVVEDTASEVEEDEFELSYIGVVSDNQKAFKIPINVEGNIVNFEIDTGASRSVAHISFFKQFLAHKKLFSVNFSLKVVTGQKVNIVGEVDVLVKSNNGQGLLALVIVESESYFTPLLGRNWLNVLLPDWRNHFLGITSKINDLFCLNSDENSQSIDVGRCIVAVKNKFKVVFNDSPGSIIKGFQASFQLKEGSIPVFHRAYDVPILLEKKVEKELSKMVESCVLEEVMYSQWASPIVIVPKKEKGEIRICVDFKKTVNRVINCDHCRLPTPEDIFASLGGSRYFSIIDLKGAYQQLEVDPQSSPLLTINTHKGLFRFKRLTYGISSAPAIFSAAMPTILSGLPCRNYLDDILVFGDSLQSCYENVIKVLSRLQEYNVKANEKKCQLFKKQVDFLGHRIDEVGIHPLPDKVKCIKECPVPQNVTQLYTT
ncbi:hypothetical protein PPYR_13684 [Photinus pyralis]|uniref:Reverse transcriptase domain-containing protein n=1 Tax=Photinus pyralis TaxID=7054 RepID=A0A5N4A9S7_PHOPY|nr:hypothetical protein PPYR_13684 [Photinus pyralis]